MTDAKIATDPSPEPVPGVGGEGTPVKAGTESAGTKPSESSDWAEGEATDELGAPPDFAADIAQSDESSRVEVLQADPTTPYHAAATFEEMGLSEELLKGVYELRFAKPSKIQASSLPLILSADGDHKNLIAQGHNGSGKTACFVLGMLSRIDTTREATQALCLVPTRELARQIGDVVASLGRFTKATTKVAVKATEEERKAAWGREEKGHLKEHIVVGTPGKVMELIKKRRLNTSAMKILVLDEADEMVDTQGMGDQTIRIKRMLPKSVQVLLFSATYADNVRSLASKLAPSANQITVKREKLSLDKIQQYYFDTGSMGERFTVLCDIYETLTIGQSIIFVGRRNEAASLSNRLRTDGHAVSLLYGGDMSPEERDRVIDEFRAGTTKVLITTNVLSRGVDVLAVSVVINYDLPTDRRGQPDPETYLHRIGRTGRFGRKGVAVNFVYDDRSRHILNELEKYYSKTITKVEDVEELEEKLREL